MAERTDPSSPQADRPDRPRARNLRTALVLASVALAFFLGTLFNHMLAR